MRIPGSLITAALALVLIAAAGPLAAATYYVDQKHPSAHDDNPGSEGAPWASLRRAMREPLAPGDTVIVKEGVYDASGGTWNRPALNPATSGTADAPITFRSEPRHAARLDSRGDDGAIGSFARDYIVIDGFELRGNSTIGVSVFGTVGTRVKGVTIQNMRISGMRGSNGGNTDGIRVERASGATIRNNEIFDIRNETGTTNAAGVKVYYSDNIVIENNEMYDLVAGVKDKEQGTNNHVRRNLIRDCSVGMELMNQNDTTTRGYHFYQNIVANCSNGFVGQTSSTAQMHDVSIHNNLFYRYRVSGVAGTRHGTNRQIFNNIFVPTGSVTSDISAYTDPAREFTLVDHNLYAQEPNNVIGLYQSNRWMRSLADWQAAGFDGYGMVADPRLRDPERGDFRPRSDSPVLNAGVLDGGVVNIGPYLQGDEVIGINNATAPAAPAGLRIG